MSSSTLSRIENVYFLLNHVKLNLNVLCLYLDSETQRFFFQLISKNTLETSVIFRLLIVDLKLCSADSLLLKYFKLCAICRTKTKVQLMMI